MDNYWQQNRLSNYYRAMANAEAKELSRVANSASLMHLKDGFVRMQFQDEISLFIREQLNKLSYAKTEDEFQACLNDIQQEKAYLIQQDQMLTSGEVALHVSAKLVVEKGILSYLIDGFGIVAGGLQIVIGFGVLFGSSVTLNPVGMLYGAMLTLHGANDAYEGLKNITSGREDNIGFTKKKYIEGAQFLGFDGSSGEIVYNMMSMGLSGYGMLRLSLKANTPKLFYYVPQDYIRGFKRMSKTDAALEAGTHTIALYNINSKISETTAPQKEENP
ncbi:DUF4225 domain-containing protein [Candidatus Pantoea multigeneris]|nr:DUF4225 domain-containing protein [Pantoea multigeneris]